MVKMAAVVCANDVAYRSRYVQLQNPHNEKHRIRYQPLKFIYTNVFVIVTLYNTLSSY